LAEVSDKRLGVVNPPKIWVGRLFPDPALGWRKKFRDYA